MAPNIYLTVGISGSGKSHFYKKVLQPLGIEELNNDMVRKELTGNISDQSMNGQVFAEVDKRTVAMLAGGKDVALTNTNLHLDKINELAKKFPYNQLKVFIVEDSQNMELCKQRVAVDIKSGIDRANTPEDIIEHQFKNFNVFLEELKVTSIEPNIIFFEVQSNSCIEKMEF